MSSSSAMLNLRREASFRPSASSSPWCACPNLLLAFNSAVKSPHHSGGWSVFRSHSPPLSRYVPHNMDGHQGTGVLPA